MPKRLNITGRYAQLGAAAAGELARAMSSSTALADVTGFDAVDNVSGVGPGGYDRLAEGALNRWQQLDVSGLESDGRHDLDPD